MPADGSCDGCVLREATQRPPPRRRPVSALDAQAMGGAFTDGSVKLFTSTATRRRRRALRHHQRRADALALPGGTARSRRPSSVMRHAAPFSLSHRAELMEWYAAFSEVITGPRESASAWRAASAAPGNPPTPRPTRRSLLGLPADAADSPARRHPRKNDDGEQQTPPRRAAATTHKERTASRRRCAGCASARPPGARRPPPTSRPPSGTG